MEANLKFYLPKEEIPMRDCLNGQRWRAVCINMDTRIDIEARGECEHELYIATTPRVPPASRAHHRRETTVSLRSLARAADRSLPA